MSGMYGTEEWVLEREIKKKITAVSWLNKADTSSSSWAGVQINILLLTTLAGLMYVVAPQVDHTSPVIMATFTLQAKKHQIRLF